MSDDNKKLLDDLGDLDWDSALDEWEKNTFVPEVAREADATKAAPPVSQDDEEQAREFLRRAAASGPTSGVAAAGAAQSALNELSGEGTVIAPVPRELRGARGPVPASSMGEPPRMHPVGYHEARQSSKPPLVAPPQRSSVAPPGSLRGGGLGQLFAKGASVRPPPMVPPAPTPPPRPSSGKTRVAPPADLANLSDHDDDDAETGERPVGDYPGYGAGKSPSVTRQVASPSVPPDAYVRESEGEGEPTLIGNSLEDAERSAIEAAARDGRDGARGGDLGDAPTISTRGLAEPPATFDSETMVADRRAGSIADADAATHHPDDPTSSARADGAAGNEERLPADDEAPTFMRPSSAGALAAAVGPATDRERGPAPEGPAEFEGERPVSRWLDAATTTSFRQRASWLEEEARALPDPREQARALLGVSELLALVGDVNEAYAFATEARELAPDLALAWRQSRQLMPRDAGALTEALDAEAARSPTPAARAHATLMAADVLRTSGDGDGAVARWNSASKLDPADVRAPAARAALALALGKHTSAGTDLAENSELIALDKAVATALKLRGAQRAGTDVDAMPINDGLRRARTALLAQDVVGAAQAVADVSAEPTLSKAALWLSALLGATHIAGRRAAAKSLKTLCNDGDLLARRQLAARGIELGDPELVTAALDGPSPTSGARSTPDGAPDDDAPVDVAEKATLLTLAGLGQVDLSASLEALSDQPVYAALLDALSAIAAPPPALAPDGDHRSGPPDRGPPDRGPPDRGPPDGALPLMVARSRRASGTTEHRALAALGRLLASKPPTSAIDEALASVPSPRGPAAAGVALEIAGKMQRWGEVSDALSSLPTGDDPNAAAQRHIAAALIAERAGSRENAKRAWAEARAQGASHDSVVRAVAALDTEVDLGTELLRIADEMPDGPAGAVLRLEALARREAGAKPFPDDEQASILERVHRGAPTLGIGAFLAERIGRRKGDVDEVLRWIQERRSYANDTLETALDSVREALLVADRDAHLASTRLEEAHRARPDDFALRELYERLATEPPGDRGAWRERRAERSSGEARSLLFTEAALEHERAGDHAGSQPAA